MPNYSVYSVSEHFMNYDHCAYVDLPPLSCTYYFFHPYKSGD